MEKRVSVPWRRPLCVYQAPGLPPLPALLPARLPTSQDPGHSLQPRGPSLWLPQPVPCRACLCPRTLARPLSPPWFPLSLHRETSLLPNSSWLLWPLACSHVFLAFSLWDAGSWGDRGSCPACRHQAGGREAERREGGRRAAGPHDLGAGCREDLDSAPGSGQPPGVTGLAPFSTLDGRTADNGWTLLLASESGSPRSRMSGEITAPKATPLSPPPSPLSETWDQQGGRWMGPPPCAGLALTQLIHRRRGPFITRERSGNDFPKCRRGNYHRAAANRRHPYPAPYANSN